MSQRIPPGPSRGSFASAGPQRSLSRFARELRREWRKLNLSDRGGVIVAVSGGADSVALLLALSELVRADKLPVEIIVAHLNHKLRGAASDADARWVAALAKQLGHRLVSGTLNTKQRASKSGDNLEQAARRGRYAFLGKVAKSHQAKLVLTAHTLNDQAETVLINLIRGSGSGGLGGIEPARPLTERSEITLARPLLSWAKRQDTEAFCRSQEIEYRTDEMNLDSSFTRVRVRNELLPLLERFNSNIVETLTRSAAILRADNAALDTAAAHLLDISLAAGDGRGPSLMLDSDVLLLAPAALRRRALRLWLGRCRGDLRRLEHAHIVAIENLLQSTKSGRAIELPGGAKVLRRQGTLQYRPARRAK
ncbi:MAG TPA: tRNA lysidine(34) synthetase TilS [Pyrinomonadaceae bacterium]|nr:tRNA lysidine(34) synthetase TilS [Pyrinomonadaceae bacterium]